MTAYLVRSSLPRLFVLAVSMALVTSVGCSSRPAAGAQMATSAGELAPTEGPIKADQVTLLVHGMSCPLCASNIDKQLLEVSGVSGVLVDMGTGEVKVSFAPKARVTRQQLENAVHKSGFTLAEVRVP